MPNSWRNVCCLRGEGVGEVLVERHKHKMTKFYGSNIQHGDSNTIEYCNVYLRVVTRVDLTCFDHKRKEKGNDIRWKMCELTLLWKFFYSILCCCYLVAQSCLTLWRPHGLSPIRLLCPWDFPGKNTGVDCQFLLQGTFLTQGLNTQTHVSCIGRKILYG